MKVFEQYRRNILKSEIIKKYLDIEKYPSVDICKQIDSVYPDILSGKAALNPSMQVSNGDGISLPWIIKLHEYINIDLASLDIFNNDYENYIKEAIENIQKKKDSINRIIDLLEYEIEKIKYEIGMPIEDKTVTYIDNNNIDFNISNISIENNAIIPRIDYTSGDLLLIDSILFNKHNDNDSIAVLADNIRVKVNENTHIGYLDINITLKYPTKITYIKLPKTANIKTISIKLKESSGNYVTYVDNAPFDSSIIPIKDSIKARDIKIILSTTEKTSDNKYFIFNLTKEDIIIKTHKFADTSILYTTKINVDKFNKIAVIVDTNDVKDISAAYSLDNKTWHDVSVYPISILNRLSFDNVSTNLTRAVQELAIDKESNYPFAIRDIYVLTGYTLPLMELWHHYDFKLLRNIDEFSQNDTHAIVFISDDIGSFNTNGYDIYLNNNKIHDHDSISAGLYNISTSSGILNIKSLFPENSIFAREIQNRESYENFKSNNNVFSIEDYNGNLYILAHIYDMDEKIYLLYNNISSADIDNYPNYYYIRALLKTENDIPQINKLGVVTA